MDTRTDRWTDGKKNGMTDAKKDEKKVEKTKRDREEEGRLAGKDGQIYEERVNIIGSDPVKMLIKLLKITHSSFHQFTS